MNVIFMGKDKKYVINALEHLIEKKINVIAIICDKNNSNEKSLNSIGKKYGIEVFDNDEMYENINKGYWKDIDLVISYLYWRLIKKEVIELGKKGCINFHPAPLPDYRGLGGYNFAILDDLDYWGASVHYVDEKIDTGELIEVVKFNLNKKETLVELEEKTQREMFELYKKTINRFLNDEIIVTQIQGNGKYINRELFEKSKEIKISDSKEEIDRKIRAFWFPPYLGANIEIDGKKYALIDEEILRGLKNEN